MVSNSQFLRLGELTATIQRGAAFNYKHPSTNQTLLDNKRKGVNPYTGGGNMVRSAKPHYKATLAFLFLDGSQ